jgi:hypothetical protein
MWTGNLYGHYKNEKFPSVKGRIGGDPKFSIITMFDYLE